MPWPRVEMDVPKKVSLTRTSGKKKKQRMANNWNEQRLELACGDLVIDAMRKNHPTEVHETLG